jgi:NitT/TauT family transport system ATP-binding protein
VDSGQQDAHARIILTLSAAVNDRSTNEPIIGIQRVDPSHHIERAMPIGAKPDVAGKIELREVGFRHGDAAILSGLSCSIGAAEHVAIIGRSGAGKSTLLHLIAGLLWPERGEILVNGSAVRGSGRGAVLMFQRPALLPWATAAENVMLPLRFSGELRRNPAAARRRALGLLEQIGLADRADALPTELSGGQQQRIALGRALAGDPTILLLDEPFSSLDSETRCALRTDVRRLVRARGATLVTVTHDLSDAAALADRAFLLSGSPARINDDVALGHDGEHQLRMRFADLRNAA